MSSFNGRPKHVLMVTSTLARGGSERQMLATTLGLMGRGYAVEIFTLGDAPANDPSFAAEFAAFGIRVTSARGCADLSLPDDGAADAHGLVALMPLIDHLNVVRLGMALEQAIRGFRPAIVHCWSDLAAVIGGSVATSLGVSRILLQLVNVSASAQGNPQARLLYRAYHRLLRNPDLVLLNISRASARNVEQVLDLPSGTVKLLYNGFLPHGMQIRKRDEVAESRRSLGLPAAPTVGALMRFAPEKDPALWLETAAIVATLRPDVRFVLAGYGALADEVARKAEALGLSDRLTLLGPTWDVGAVYGAIDVFLMTSRFEGTPNVLIEAQAAGVPVVAPAVGGIGETLVDGVTGVLVADRTAAKISGAVLRILDDPLWRARAAQRGPKFVAAQFALRRKVDRTIGFYDHGRDPGRSPLRGATHGLSALMRSGADFVLNRLRGRRVGAVKAAPPLIPQRVAPR